ncbi:MAG TPA: tRNA (guanosine(37)-N1)-methyltransferase TrmD [Terriglobales bacterium]|nr:tRNA (guanosine(37)-N1)-methyltransferase TrmD [Terriglobales bacterium]
MQIEIVTIFPDFFRGPLDYGIVRRAREAGLVKIRVHDLRAFTRDRHRTVDDRPFGGGAGMVLKPEPIFECVESLDVAAREERAAVKQSVVLLSAQGTRFDQKLASELSELEQIVLICGRYEGVDERVGMFLADREISIGDYVLSGGELGATVIVDTVTRLIPGAVGNEASTRQESFVAGAERGANDLADKNFRPAREPAQSGNEIKAIQPDSTCGSGGLLDYPHYTRPADFRGMKVPEVLVNGNHEEIKRWRRRSALEKTLTNRPDLLEQVGLTEEDRELLQKR